MPAYAVQRLKFQRGDEGHPLDDIIVDTISLDGSAAGLDVQVKRSITFAPGDVVFKKVIGQIAASLNGDVSGEGNRRFGIATAISSRKITGPIQDVLTWARAVDDPKVFHARFVRKGVAAPEMASFVETVRQHLGDAGALADDTSVWRLLRRLGVMVFDFTSPDSASLLLARQQCALALPAKDAGRGADLWSALVEIALKAAAAGGEIDRGTLIAELRIRAFDLAGDRQNAAARRSLAEDSALAVAAIDDSVAGTILYRPERLNAVHAALDSGRYLEIRGAGGVGKSGLLKHLAGTIQAEGALVVLSPNRVPEGGWSALRDRIGYEGLLPELLGELAMGGGGLVLIDNVEGFSTKERATAVDVVNAAASVPSISVVVTARPELGTDDQPNWLPETALDRLGRAPVVVIEELTDDERADLRRATPGLATLLGSDHPARAIVGNLYRLKRLAALRPDEAVRTEIDLARRWWRQADGDPSGRRDRVRLLEFLAEQTVSGVERYDVSTTPSLPIDALVASDTLSELGPNHATFRHDVLRDWAVANWLADDVAHVAKLPLTSRAPARLVRGLELLARDQLARDTDGAKWANLFAQVSVPDVHGSWRRTALLAVVRADDGVAQLTKLMPRLLENDAALLVELIRTVMAVEVRPADEFFTGLGVDPADIPDGMTTPYGPAWGVLISVISKIPDQIPPSAVGTVASLYRQWLIVVGSVVRGTDHLARQLYGWMTKLGPADRGHWEGGGWFNSLERHEIDSLASNLRSTFVAFAALTPDLARQYIADLRAGRASGENLKAAIKFAGGLPIAAPEDYVDLVVYALVEPLKEPVECQRDRDDPFTFLDHDFMPESPAQGPFLALLKASPKAGLALVRQLVDHEIAWSRRRGASDDTFTIGLGARKREVSAPWAYQLARRQARGHAVQCALMAVEAWGHARIEAGEKVDAVIQDIWGDAPLTAPFVLTAVDLALSHEDETSSEILLDLLASPELLAMDRLRQGQENMGGLDVDWFGIKSLQREPGQGVNTAKALKERWSRHIALERVLPNVVFRDVPHATLAAHYEQEFVRLGPPRPYAAFSDATFMAAHVRNVLNRANWVAPPDQPKALAYQPPADESRHLAALATRHQKQGVELSTTLDLNAAVEDPARSTPALVDAAVERLGKPRAEVADSVIDNDRQVRAHAAYVVARDAQPDVWARVQATITAELVNEKERDHDHFGGDMSFLMYNPPGLAFLGLAYAWRRAPDRDGAERLLIVASAGGRAAGQAFETAASLLAEFEPRLPLALLRCALVGARSVRGGYWDEDDTEAHALVGEFQKVRARAVAAELAWLFYEGPEPSWPELTPRTPRPRRRSSIRLPGGKPKTVAPFTEPTSQEPWEYFHHQAAASWVVGALNTTDDGWTQGFVAAYLDWTFISNGLGLDAFDEVGPDLHLWTDGVFTAVGRAAGSWNADQFRTVVTEPFSRLPERSILMVAPAVTGGLDGAVFARRTLDTVLASALRAQIADVVMATRGWRDLAGVFSTQIEFALGPAVASLFFARHEFGLGAASNLYAPAIDRLEPYLAQLEKQVIAGPSYYVAICLLGLAEVAPRPSFLPLLLTAGEVWLQAFPANTAFWVDHATGRRLCRLYDCLLSDNPTALEAGSEARRRLEAILPRLVTLGVAEANLADERLAS